MVCSPAALSAYVSTNSGEQGKTDEIMGPTARADPGPAGCGAPGFRGASGAWESEPRSQDATSRSGLPLPDYQPHLPQLPPHWNWLLLTLSLSQRALISPIALHFKIAIEIAVHFFLS